MKNVDLREVSRTKALLAKHGIPVPQGLLDLMPRIKVTLMDKDINAIETLLEDGAQVVLTYRKDKPTDRLSILTLDRYGKLIESLKSAQDARRTKAGKTTKTTNVSTREHDGLTLIPRLPTDGVRGGYVADIAAAVKKHGTVGIYVSAFSTAAAKNSAAASFRNLGFNTGKSKKGKATLLLVSENDIKKETAEAKKARTKGIRGKAWTTDCANAAEKFKALPQDQQELFKTAYHDGSLTNSSIAEMFGFSDTKVSAVGIGMGWKTRSAVRAMYNYAKDQQEAAGHTNGATAGATAGA